MITLAEIQATGLPLDDHGALAEALSVGRTKVVSRTVDIGTVMIAMEPYGGEFLNTLEELAATVPKVKWTLKMIEAGTLNVGLPSTRKQLQDFAEETPSVADAISALLAVAVVQDTVTSQEVTRALEGVV